MTDNLYKTTTCFYLWFFFSLTLVLETGSQTHPWKYIASGALSSFEPWVEKINISLLQNPVTLNLNLSLSNVSYYLCLIPEDNLGPTSFWPSICPEELFFFINSSLFPIHSVEFIQPNLEYTGILSLPLYLPMMKTTYAIGVSLICEYDECGNATVLIDLSSYECAEETETPPSCNPLALWQNSTSIALNPDSTNYYYLDLEDFIGNFTIELRNPDGGLDSEILIFADYEKAVTLSSALFVNQNSLTILNPPSGTWYFGFRNLADQTKNLISYAFRSEHKTKILTLSGGTNNFTLSYGSHYFKYIHRKDDKGLILLSTALYPHASKQLKTFVRKGSLPDPTIPALNIQPSRCFVGTDLEIKPAPCNVQQYIRYANTEVIWFLRIDIEDSETQVVIWTETFCPKECLLNNGVCNGDVIFSDRGTCTCPEPTDTMTFYCQLPTPNPKFMPIEYIILFSITGAIISGALVGFLFWMIDKWRKRKSFEEI